MVSRQSGSIDELPSGAFRVRVYAGIDPLTKKQHYLTEVIPPGPNAEKVAKKTRTRLVHQVDERKSPRVKATLQQLLNRYLETVEIAEKTLETYQGYVDKRVLPVLGSFALSQIDGEVLDSFYAKLRKECQYCGNLVKRGAAQQKCPQRKRSKCKPLANSTIRQIHWILSGAFRSAVRWRWVSVNPLEQAEPPSQPTPSPHPPTPEQAAQILERAWSDPDWGVFLWLAMRTGARRGELCALRWSSLNAQAGVLTIASNLAQSGSRMWEKDTKTHQQRRIALDAADLEILAGYRSRREKQCDALSTTLEEDAYLLSPVPDASEPWKPDTVTQRYSRMCTSLGWEMTLHSLRHYSATELITAGVDIRTVAGRLGHSGGGTTTLKVYAAWVSEADQRAASLLSERMPKPPTSESR